MSSVKFVILFVMPLAILFSLAPLQTEGKTMSMQQPIARITKIDEKTFKIEMMPAEKKDRIVKQGDPLFAAYASTFSTMKVGEKLHVTELPDAEQGQKKPSAKRTK